MNFDDGSNNQLPSSELLTDYTSEDVTVRNMK